MGSALTRNRFCDQRLSRTGWRTDQNSLVTGKPGQQCLFLYGIGFVEKLIEIAACQFLSVDYRV